MTVEVVVNPDDTTAYLAGLNSCFPGFWDERVRRWYLGRELGGEAPDVVGVYAGAELVAGLGVNYRRVRTPDGAARQVGVLTAAWTLPKHRGRWHFWRLIERSKTLAKQRGCSVLLSFVTADNASATVLARVRAARIPTYYVHAEASSALTLPESLAEPIERLPPELPRDGGPADAIRFDYDASAWREQLLRRPEATAVFDVGASVAVVEQAAAADRLQWLSGSDDSDSAALAALLARARGRGKPFFHFTMSAALARAAAGYGATVRSGAMMLIDLGDGDSDWWHAEWRVQAGDRM